MTLPYLQGAFVMIAGGASDLSPLAKLVLERLAWHADQTGVAWPGQITLGYEVGRSDRSVRRAMKEIRAFGLVKEVSHGGGPENHWRSSRWQLVFEPVDKLGRSWASNALGRYEWRKSQEAERTEAGNDRSSNTPTEAGNDRSSPVETQDIQGRTEATFGRKSGQHVPGKEKESKELTTVDGRGSSRSARENDFDLISPAASYPSPSVPGKNKGFQQSHLRSDVVHSEAPKNPAADDGVELPRDHSPVVTTPGAVVPDEHSPRDRAAAETAPPSDAPLLAVVASRRNTALRIAAGIAPDVADGIVNAWVAAATRKLITRLGPVAFDALAPDEGRMAVTEELRRMKEDVHGQAQA